MARILSFKIKGHEFIASPTKVDRRKLYGWTELVVTDTNGNLCRQAAINSDGVTIIDQGATKLGIVTEDGLWVERNELIAVDSSGNEIKPVASSFDCGCLLEETATIDEILNLNVSSVYQISMDNDLSFRNEIGETIYKFRFNYNSGVFPAMAFLLANSEGIFMLTGTPATVEFLSLDESGVIDDTDEFEIDEDLDFGMM